MSNIIVIIIITLLLVALLEYGLLPKLFGGEEEEEEEEEEEGLFVDEKVHITILKDNYSQLVPAKIGIEPNLWKDHSLANYSLEPNTISPLNTKRYDGVVHIQSIYDREFTFGDFLNIWGFDKNKINTVFLDDNKTKDYEKLALGDGQNLKLFMKKENVSFVNFEEYNDTKIMFEYPSEWYFNDSTMSTNSEYGSSSNKTSHYTLGLYPKESQYMDTPFFYIQIKKLDSNKTELNEYYKNNIYKVLEADENTFPKFLNYTEFNLNDTLAYKIFLNTTLIAEPGVKDRGNSINQTSFHIWTIQNGYFYDISFKAFESVYNEYYPIIERIINSIKIKN
jgi:hypothetical protein